MIILGISCYYHDAAAALLVNGELVAAAQEERFTRKKHDASYPKHAIQYCLKEAGIKPEDVDIVAFYDKPFLKFERILETYLAFVPKGIRSAVKALPLWIKEKMWISDHLQKGFRDDVTLIFPEHHESHAASAFFPSPFEQAAVLTIDGVGEWATSSIGFGNGKKLEILKELHFPHSLGLLYSAFTYFTGFKVNSGEYKLMGLAPYGKPIYTQKIYDYLIDLKEDGSFRMNMDYFDYAAGLTMTSNKFDTLFDGPARKPESKITQREMDLAASIQKVTEDIMLRMAKTAKALTGAEHLCLAGGVALNCVGNGVLQRSGLFKKIWIQPAAGDAGGALGAALLAWHGYLEQERSVPSSLDGMKGSYLGPSFSSEYIAEFVKANTLIAHELDDARLLPLLAHELAQDKVVGWFNGRMEFGPRALGARSILGNPKSAELQKTLNLKIKFRESFRPFAPSVLRDDVAEWFDLNADSPYMLLVDKVSDRHKNKELEPAEGFDKLYQIRSELPAITHVDGSARIQTVHKETNPRYYALIEAFKKVTGCGVLINTSFNVRGEPIVCTPEDAYRCFMRTNMDILVLENTLFYKSEQTKVDDDSSWTEEYELD